MATDADVADALPPPKPAGDDGGGAAGEKRWPSQSRLSPEAQRRMRYYLSCAIIDLKFDLWDHIQTHFVLEPSRRDLEENLDPTAGDGESSDDGDSSGSAGERGSSSHRSDVKLGDAEEDTNEEEEEEDEYDRFNDLDSHFVVLKPSRHNLKENLHPAAGDGDSDDDDGEEANDDHRDSSTTCGFHHRPDVDADDDEEDTDDEEEAIEKAKELLEHNELWREFTDKYIIATGYDDRMKEMDAIEEVYFDTTMDEETRTDMIDKLWRQINKELSDRARAVSTGKFNF
uniref:Uncharacterized protein n=1 Tax=Oryza punctata TaxID=4537 RepID=A0A0E0LSM6_ORYPU